jgi:hypothetical protein
LSEIRDRHAERRAVDDVVGDHRALETEFGVERNFPEAAAGITDDLQVRGGVAAHRGESGIANAVAAHDHVVGAKDVNGVAPLAGSTGFVHDAFDAVVDDQSAVVARRAAPDQNAAIAGAVDRVAGNLQAARIDRENRRVAAADGVVGDFALDRLERNSVAPGIDDLAIGHTDRAPLRYLQQAAAFRQRNSRAVENDAGDSNIITASGGHHRRASRHHDARGPGNTFDRGIRGQLQRAGAIKSRRQMQGRACGGSLLDGALQNLGLVVRSVRAKAERDGIKLAARRGVAYRRRARLARSAERA